MHLFGRNALAPAFLALIFTGSILREAYVPTQNPASQTQSSGSSKPTRHDSLEVVAKLTPEEVEEGKLNDAYESIAQQQGKGTCSPESNGTNPN